MKPTGLIGSGLFMGIGLGQDSSWLLLRTECHNAPGLIALSTFGPGMIIFGMLWMAYLFLRRRPAGD